MGDVSKTVNKAWLVRTAVPQKRQGVSKVGKVLVVVVGEVCVRVVCLIVKNK